MKATTNLAITPLLPSNPEPNLLFQRTHHARFRRNNHPISIVQENRERVLKPRRIHLSLGPDERRNPFRHPEQNNGLVE